MIDLSWLDSVGPSRRRPPDERRFRPLPGRLSRPAFLVLAAFALAIVVGTGVLALPVSHRHGDQVSLLDTFFTATSAVTVTGLGVVDTEQTWSGFGLFVIAVLIQIGGLGVMTLAGFIGLVLSRRMRFASRTRIAVETGLDDGGNLAGLVVDLVRFVVLAEAVAAVALTWRFWQLGHGGASAAGHGLFHAVSAFNNAGFSTFSDSLAGAGDDPVILLVTAAAFIVGGLGFPVVFELGTRNHPRAAWSLHTRVTLATTAVLLVGGWVLIAAVEWTNPATLGDLSTGDRLVAAFFQSATARTAGFNSIDVGALRPASLLLTTLLMVIGAGSASTGGGLKVTTLAVIAQSTVAEFRRDKALVLGGRRITPEIHREALALVAAAVLTVTAGAYALSAISPGLSMESVMFESASAFGTVGLSTGITADFGWLGRLILCALMFIGRVGPVTFGTAVLLRPRPRRVGQPDGSLLIG
jgi:potassium uptake TrkH family protein